MHAGSHYHSKKGHSSVTMVPGTESMKIRVFLAACDAANLNRQGVEKAL